MEEDNDEAKNSGGPPPTYRSTSTKTTDSPCDWASAQRELAMDRILSLLAARRRRMLLYYCISQPFEPVSIEQLITQLMEWEQALGTTYPDHQDRLRYDLQQIHLPRLEANDIIAYSWEKRRCHYRGDPLIEHLLDEIVSYESWE